MPGGLFHLPYNLIRPQYEEAVLSKGLADCVTYLKALREKQARIGHQLNVDSAASQKKRKKMQQIKRHLTNEIKNRERDEDAFLNNLQACKANIFLANMKAYHTATASFHAPGLDYTPSLHTPTLCSYAESETTDLTWDGWTDEAAVSPFQKYGGNAFFTDDVAPDAYPVELRRDSALSKDAKCFLPLSRDRMDMSNLLPVPPNTAQSHFMLSTVLSPAAAVFEPTPDAADHLGERRGKGFNRLSISSPMVSCVQVLRSRCSSTGDIRPILPRFSTDVRADPKSLPGHTWSPQSKSQKETGVQMNRPRSLSL
ncbi:hypothetical protein EJ07DRAFT_174186 [Lizonia empirigonia]|nr:hypothetical protein EJ07DRAFT_174186 [Lizonia empirigonia]